MVSGSCVGVPSVSSGGHVSLKQGRMWRLICMIEAIPAGKSCVTWFSAHFAPWIVVWLSREDLTSPP